MLRSHFAVDGLVVTLIVHALNRDSVNHLSFQSPTASVGVARRRHRLFFSPSRYYILCLICQCVSSENFYLQHSCLLQVYSTRFREYTTFYHHITLSKLMPQVILITNVVEEINNIWSTSRLLNLEN